MTRQPGYERRQARTRRGWAAFVVAACVGAAACGARTDLAVAPLGALPADAAPVPAKDAGDAPDAPVALDGGFANDAACGAPWVVFVYDAFVEPKLYALRADGTDGHVVPLPHDGPSFPWISADGALLVYSTQSGQDLYLHRFADGSDQLLATPSGIVDGFAAVSPDGTGLAYSTNAGLEYAPLSGSPARAGTARLLVAKAAHGFLGDGPGFPSFFANGGEILFGTHTAIGSVRLDGTGVEGLLTNPSGFVGIDNAAVSPDGTEIVAGVACPAGTYGLRVYQLGSLPADCTTGRLIAQFNPPGAAPFYPTWGPSGLIAYWNGAKDIALVDAEGGTPRLLTTKLTGTGDATMPAWAPACTRL